MGLNTHRLFSEQNNRLKEILLAYGKFKSGYGMQATLISYSQTQHWYNLGAQVIAKNK